MRDAGGLDRGIAEALDVGLIRGPRVLRSGRVLSQTGGHGDTIPSSNDPHLCAGQIASTSFAHIADGPDAVRRAAREELKGGADQIKVMAGGGVATPTDPIDMVHTFEEIRAAVEEARRGAPTPSRTPTSPTPSSRRSGPESGPSSTATSWTRRRASWPNKTFLVPTLVVYEQIAALGRQWGFPAESLAKLDPCARAGERAVRIAVDAGVRLGFGTDLLETQPAQNREFALRGAAQPPLEVLQSATVINAELLGRAGDLGTLQPGSAADVLLVNGNPLADLSVLVEHETNMRLVIRAGEIILERERP